MSTTNCVTDPDYAGCANADCPAPPTQISIDDLVTSNKEAIAASLKAMNVSKCTHTTSAGAAITIFAAGAVANTTSVGCETISVQASVVAQYQSAIACVLTNITNTVSNTVTLSNTVNLTIDKSTLDCGISITQASTSDAKIITSFSQDVKNEIAQILTTMAKSMAESTQTSNTEAFSHEGGQRSIASLSSLSDSSTYASQVTNVVNTVANTLATSNSVNLNILNSYIGCNSDGSSLTINQDAAINLQAQAFVNTAVVNMFTQEEASEFVSILNNDQTSTGTGFGFSFGLSSILLIIFLVLFVGFFLFFGKMFSNVLKYIIPITLVGFLIGAVIFGLDGDAIGMGICILAVIILAVMEVFTLKNSKNMNFDSNKLNPENPENMTKLKM